MIPINLHQQVSQHKISGLAIASGRAVYLYADETEDGDEGFVFMTPADFQLLLNAEELTKMGVSVDDMMDCVDQVEEDLGNPIDIRSQYSLYTKAGWTNVGTVFTSRTNPKVSCQFTPVSFDFERDRVGDKKTEGFFAWYYNQEKQPDYDNDMDDFDVQLKGALANFDDLIGGQYVGNVVSSPALPEYGEACHRLAHLVDISESVRQQFLGRLWDYNHALAAGMRPAVKRELMAEWKRLTSAPLDEVEEALKKK